MEIPLLVHHVCGLNLIQDGTQLVYSTGFFGGTPRDVKNAQYRATPSLSLFRLVEFRALIAKETAAMECARIAAQGGRIVRHQHTSNIATAGRLLETRNQSNQWDSA
jgi:hypothetical protein